jgi:protein-S-isoprenylcysteine O-methyltransferase Ste14
VPLAVVSLVVIVIWLAVVAGLRSYLHYRRTGTVPVPTSKPPGSAAWWARLLSSLGSLLTIAAPITDLLGLQPIGALDVTALRLFGLALAFVGIVGAFAAQSAMGASWRGDVDPDARTELITDGPFRLVRNPILACTMATTLGLALLVPNGVALVGLALVVAALQVQVRLVEEPYLIRVHGDAYRRYAARTGRFVPWFGKLPPG